MHLFLAIYHCCVDKNLTTYTTYLLVVVYILKQMFLIYYL